MSKVLDKLRPLYVREFELTIGVGSKLEHR